MITTTINESEIAQDNYTGILKIKYNNGHTLTITMKDGLRHSFDDEPAWDNGKRKIWYKNGEKHRVCVPADIIPHDHYVDEYYCLDDITYFVNTSQAPSLSSAINDYWRACWQYRTAKNEQLIAAKLLAGKTNE